MLPRHGSYGGEAIQALLDNITMPEFHGKLIIILGGYEEDVVKLFEANSGLQSRFDKRRIHFPEWTGEMAAAALTKAAARQNMMMAGDAQSEALRLFNELHSLPNWASARDYDTGEWAVLSRVI